MGFSFEFDRWRCSKSCSVLKGTNWKHLGSWLIRFMILQLWVEFRTRFAAGNTSFKVHFNFHWFLFDWELEPKENGVVNQPPLYRITILLAIMKRLIGLDLMDGAVLVECMTFWFNGAQIAIYQSIWNIALFNYSIDLLFIPRADQYWNAMGKCSTKSADLKFHVNEPEIFTAL